MSFHRHPSSSRRQFFKALAGLLAKSASVGALVMTAVRPVAAFFDRQILSADTDPLRLENEDPQYLDTRNLKITPIRKFDTMGDSTVAVDLGKWRLTVAGDVKKPLQLSYPELLKLPAIEKKALLICAGLFSYHARYKGISLKTLLKMSGGAKTISKVAFHGQGEFLVGKKERFPIEEIEEDRLFLAYAVNGKPLPQKHGFPLRLVANDYYGDTWVK
jgi:sulfoxide reductase catalytic subunit YedY